MLTINKTTSFLAGVLLAMAAPVFSDSIPIEDGCTPIATMHRAECMVTTVMACGDHFIDDSYIAGKRIDRHIFGKEWGLIGYVADDDKITNVLDTLTEGGITIKAMLEEGSSSSTRAGTFNTNIIKDRKVGMDQLYEFDGEMVEISGVNFHKGKAYRTFKMHPTARALDTTWTFDIYLSEDHGMFFEGAGESVVNGKTRQIPFAPVSLSLPGQEGFAVDRASDAACQ